MKRFLVSSLILAYRYLARPIIFIFDSEKVHVFVLEVGEVLGKIPLFPELLKKMFFVGGGRIGSDVAGIRFPGPVGLAAGFDYEAQLPAILPGLGFGFGTVGTVTLGAYDGNPKPRLARLPKSQALLVNKGFKSPGIKFVLERLARTKLSVPLGISIGRTNTANLKTNEEAIADIVSSFRLAESSSVPFSYYELNISCPNLASGIEFYAPEKLLTLLTAVTALGLKKPLFIKMPIDRTDEETRGLLDVILAFPVAGVIFGNLQKDRRHPTLDQNEVAKYPKGNFSGRPCATRSDELIRLAYEATRGQLIIIGCGGVFTAEDAYRKIRLGASLIQLASALVYRGPLVPAEISAEIKNLLARDGFASLALAVGVDALTP